MNQSLHRSTHRVFCAIELPTEIRAQAAGHIMSLREAMPDVRAGWERPEKLHITLKFLGNIEQAYIASLSRAAEQAASRVQPFEMALEGTGVFPARGTARVLWLGIIDQSGELARLHSQLEDECVRAGFPREERDFHPHLTIARLRTHRGAQGLSTRHREIQFKTDTFTVNEIVVMQSELAPGGSRYTALSKHGLGERS